MRYRHVVASNGPDEAAIARVEAVLEQLEHVDLQVIVVAPPDAERVAARERARAAAEAAGRSALFDETVSTVREGVLRAYARGAYSGTWAVNDWSMSVTNAGDRLAAAAAFEEAAIAAVVEDLVEEETLAVLRATTVELDLAAGIPSPGALSSLMDQRRRGGSQRVGRVVLGAGIALASLGFLAIGAWIGAFILVGGAAAAAWLAGRTRSAD